MRHLLPGFRSDDRITAGSFTGRSVFKTPFLQRISPSSLGKCTCWLVFWMKLLVSDRTAGKYRNVTMTGQQL